MSALFLSLLERSLSASIVVLAVLVLRLLLKQSPKWIAVALWALVAVRLLCPISITSPLSLMPETQAVLSDWSDDYVGEVHIIHQGADGYEDAVTAGRKPIYGGENSYYVVTGSDNVSAPATVETDILPGLCWLWLCGMALMGLYAMVSTLRLRQKVETAVRLRGSIYQSEFVDSPFVLGLLRPRIYLPYRMDSQTMGQVIAHEQAHIRRKDHWWKSLGFALLTIHWFNPLLWVSYVLLCRDIELACDEAVIQHMDSEQKADYAQALLTCSIHPRTAVSYPLAFGEVGIKQRISNLAQYKKPALWMTAVAVALCAVAALCFLTAPTEEAPAADTAGNRLREAAHYLELAAQPTEFDDMDEEEAYLLLEEYGELLVNFRLYSRKSVDGGTSYILGVWDEAGGPNPLADMHTMWHSPAYSDEEFEVIYHKDDSEAVDMALMNGETPENAYIIKNSWMSTSMQNDLFLIVPNDNALSLWSGLYIYLNTPNGSAYIESAAERGVSITDITPPYLEIYLISPEYGEITEKINLTQQEASQILNEEKTALEDGYGLAATLHWNDSTHYTENTGIPPTVLQYAVENCGYVFACPADITAEITEARLNCDWLSAPIYADTADLHRLRQILTNAEFGFVGACGYGAKLTITLADGRELTLYKGTDSCDSMVFGSFGGYFIGDNETVEFWDMFGLDFETKQPLS